MIKTLTKAYQALIFYSGFLKSPILLLCRLYWGGRFFMAGWAKLHNISQFAQMLDTYHFPIPSFMAYSAALSEFFCGACLIVGFASRLAAIPLIIVMVTAYFTVHADSLNTLFHKPSSFIAEAPFNFLLASLLVLAFGPGRFSIDYMIEKWLFSRAEEIPKHQHFS